MIPFLPEYPIVQPTIIKGAIQTAKPPNISQLMVFS